MTVCDLDIFSNMPNAEGITAITAWMISCIFCVFCALMCYAYLLWRLRPSMLKVLTTTIRFDELILDYTDVQLELMM